MKQRHTKEKQSHCVYCSYFRKTVLRCKGYVPLAVEIVETPSGPRALCEKHARDAVRVTDTTCKCGSINCTNCHWARS